jgi:hypothetical protein
MRAASMEAAGAQVRTSASGKKSSTRRPWGHVLEASHSQAGNGFRCSGKGGGICSEEGGRPMRNGKHANRRKLRLHFQRLCAFPCQCCDKNCISMIQGMGIPDLYIGYGLEICSEKPCFIDLPHEDQYKAYCNKSQYPIQSMHLAKKSFKSRVNFSCCQKVTRYLKGFFLRKGGCLSFGMHAFFWKLQPNLIPHPCNTGC